MDGSGPEERLATPAGVCLPVGSFMVEDEDEEIFLLYTRKLESQIPDDGLGFVETKAEMIPISITVQEPAWEGVDQGWGAGRGAKAKKGRKARKEVTVELELHQDLDKLRNRPGDTASVLWRVSLHLAKFLLSEHHFPPAAPLFPTWSSLEVLELGSGTGFLGLAIGSTVKSWTFSDQLTSLNLLLKNRRKNATAGAAPLGEVREVNWIDEAADSEQKSGRTNRLEAGNAFPDLIVAADCIYNPALSAPLARTINHLAGPATLALVASELRDNEPLELFLKEWLALGWKIARVVLGAAEADGLGRRSFVVWVGWR